jgi:phosphoserine phosphatase
MTQNDAQSELFTGLILLTGIDKPGIANKLFEALSPFAVRILDVEQIVNNHRLILTVLIRANPAHQNAIEEDLNACALALDVDIATLFTKGILPAVPTDLVEIKVTSPKLTPNDLAQITLAISQNNGNVERIQRLTSDPVSIQLIVSGVGKQKLSETLSGLTFENDTELSIND